MDKGPTCTPKRLQAVLPLLRDMAFRHRELEYQALRNKICPSTVCGIMTARSAVLAHPNFA